jgi:hypothetical protein
MRNSMIVATMLATSALTVALSSGANAGRYDKPAAHRAAGGASYASDDAGRQLNKRVSRPYKAERQRRRDVAYKRTERERKYAYPHGPWGPFAAPPGLF